MYIFLVFICGLYVTVILALWFGWLKIPVFKLNKIAPEIKFSIVVPFRNEAENLPILLRSITKLKYPPSHFELLLINDASEDDSRKICSDFKKAFPNFQIRLAENVHVSDSPKKDAIAIAIQLSKFEHILTTDADCIVPEYWLQAFNEKILESEAKLIAGPVKIIPPEFPVKDKKLLHVFQELDFMSLQAAGAGGFGLGKAFICNGANLCYEKSSFYAVDGFSGNGNISSGDDVFLLQKFTAKKWETVFLKSKEAIVLTLPQQDLTSLISQRIRWAAKTPAYNSIFAKIVGLAVLLMNLFLIIAAILALFNFTSYKPLAFAFLFKFLVDLLLLYKSAEFFERKAILRNYFWSSLLYPFFSTSVAILSLFIKSEWKGRKSKK